MTPSPTGSTRWKRARAGALIVCVLAGLTACTNAVSPNVPGSHSADRDKAAIGLLLPDSVTTRYEAADHPDFVAEIDRLCPDCTVQYQNAAADAGKQQAQAEAMLSQGVRVLVLDAVDGEAAAAIVNDATMKNVPVIAYDRLIDSTSLAYYITFDPTRVGVLQGTSLVDKLRADHVPRGSGIIMVNGSPTDNNAVYYKKGAHSVIDKSGYTVLAQYDTPDWAGSEAQSWVAGQLTQFGSRIHGVYAANDDLAQGAIAAMQAADLKPIPPTTGQDAELAGVQRVLEGSQYMTVYKAIKPQAQKAARVAIELLHGHHPQGESMTKTKSGGEVPTTVLDPIAVTAKNVESTVVAAGFYTAKQICTAPYRKYCQKYGVS